MERIFVAREAKPSFRSCPLEFSAPAVLPNVLSGFTPSGSVEFTNIWTMSLAVGEYPLGQFRRAD
jgi:hypothetical protein